MNLATATLYTGATYATTGAVIHNIQELFCKHTPVCRVCFICTSIKNKDFHSLLWITPEQRYTLDDIEPIFKRSEYLLADNQAMVIVLEHADRLTTATANALLKLIEEPPTGYYFFFTAQRAAQVLPTIASRCHIHALSTEHAVTELEPFEQFFMSKTASASAFYTSLSYCPTEIDTPAVVDTLIKAWTKKYMQALTTHDTQQVQTCLLMLDLLKKQLATPPMPGSAKLFWKNLFIQKETCL